MLIPVTLLESGGGGGLFDAYAYLRDEQNAGVAGGSSTTGSFLTRPLNTEVFDPDGIVSLSANQFTLQPGTYLIRARAPGLVTGVHKAKIRDITNGADAGIGTSAYGPGNATNGDQQDSWVTCRVTVAVPTTYELQHRFATARATDGFGAASNFGVVEVYSEVWIYREA